jgi:CheY-like chemotaxis protein
MPHVLIVDDALPIRFLVREILADDPTLRFSEAANGLQALETITRDRPDLVILDIMMPHMSGIQVCEVMQAQPALQDIPVVFVSAKDENDLALARLSRDDRSPSYITKPFEPAELEDTVQQMLHRGRSSS